jgi:nucleotide-binding universal stress UspA family protein
MKTAIVCGVDGSDGSRAALAVAADLADRLDARLVLVHAVHEALPSYDGVAAIGIGAGARPAPAATLQQQEQAAGQLLARMAADTGVEPVWRRVVTGQPAERLAAVAEEEGAELIVVGSRGRGPLTAALLGSVSTSLIGAARCPVVVVPARAVRD